MTTTGLDGLLSGRGPGLGDAALGLISHPASVTRTLVPAADALLDAGFNVRALFGPQHGALGEKQDNMIESAHFVDVRTGLPVHSLYSETRKPTPAMLDGLDAVLCDLQDVGVKVYTFVWTMALAMEACAEAGVRFIVLDRPNPIGGVIREGPVLQPGFESFVGLHPLPLRHGLTLGEIALWLKGERGIECELDVVPCEGWRREHWWDETGLPWVLPSPNLPTLDSCTVYPGMVLVEGTNLSEGRGTTRPFEFFGAPYLDAYELSEALGRLHLPGLHFRPCTFQPTFQKHVGQVCGGAQIHVTDRRAGRSVAAAVAILSEVRRQAPQAFEWIPPPYEYEHEIMPIDILWGGDGLRLGIDGGLPPEQILQGAASEIETFQAQAEAYLLYE